MKKFASLLIILSICINCVSVSAYSNTSNNIIHYAKKIHSENQSQNKDTSLNITAKAAVLIENNSGRILYQQKKDEELIPASITKIMTLILIFEAIHDKKISLKDKVSVSEYAASMGGSEVFLEPGEIQTVDTMIKCISIASGNDAAVAMAEFVAGSEPAFVKKMNKKAKELGMKHTHFINCNGLDDTIESGHYSSAYDVALMSRELVTKYPEISNYSTVWMDEITHSTKKGDSQFGLTNTNKLIRTYQGITGLKTGSTSKAKYCLSATAIRNGINLTAVIMAAPDPKERFIEAAALLDYGFANCTNFTEKIADVPLKEQKIHAGVKDKITPRIEKNFSYTLCGNESSDKIKREILYKKSLTSPINEGEQIGSIEYTLSGKKIGTIPIVAAETVKKASYTDYLHKMLLKLFIS